MNWQLIGAIADAVLLFVIFYKLNKIESNLGLLFEVCQVLIGKKKSTTENGITTTEYSMPSEMMSMSLDELDKLFRIHNGSKK